jgi:hypothetical protein
MAWCLVKYKICSHGVVLKHRDNFTFTCGIQFMDFSMQNFNHFYSSAVFFQTFGLKSLKVRLGSHIKDHAINRLHKLGLLHVTCRLEHLLDVLRRKINGVSVDEKPASSEQSPSESLASTVSSSSTTHSPQVTMSGPVTDL